MPPIITLLTDFGTADGYVGEVKSVLMSQAPNATIVDIAHDVPAHDVDAGRLALSRYWKRFPAGTVHLAVVDPGVGSDRAALAVASDGRFLVGPDNGLLSPALLEADARAVELPIPPDASPTFHARDVFAPAAAALARGVALDSLGKARAQLVTRRTPEPRRSSTGDHVGEIIAIDHFGNAITNLRAGSAARVRVASYEMPLERTYASIARGKLGAVTGSTGFVEIVVRDGRACDTPGIGRGVSVRLREMSS